MADPPKVNTSPSKERAEYSELLKKVLTALFYGISSFMIMVVNKRVLTVYSFPSFQVLGIGQMLATILILSVGKSLKIISFPDLSTETFRKIWPLPLMYLGNMVFGLGGTQNLSLPMMTVLRRFSILMTMIGEYYVLKVRPSTSIQLSVYLMIFGSLVAASNDLAFNLKGYTYVLLNDFFTAGNGVLMKKKLESKDLGKYGLMYYNSLFMLLPASIFAFQTGDLSRVYEFEGWKNPWFTFQFFLSCFFGFILIFSTVLCTAHNSALTTTIIGCLKNILITYMGMFIGGDYKYSLINFLGLNISVIGSLVYTKVTFSSKSKPSTTLPMTNSASVGEKS